MLAKPETKRCIECGTPFDSPMFHYHYGRVDHGAAYWSDRGILCSPQCSMTHFKRRRSEGTLSDAPASDPTEMSRY